MRRGTASTPVAGLLTPIGAEILTIAESAAVTGTKRTDVPASPLPRRSASVTVGPSESPKLHAENECGRHREREQLRDARDDRIGALRR